MLTILEKLKNCLKLSQLQPPSPPKKPYKINDIIIYLSVL